MDKRYKNLMQQQDVDAQITAQFYEKLENKQRKPIGWKVALAVACLALMIPATVFAVEHLIRVPKVKLGQLQWTDNPNGYSVRFENMDAIPLEAFPEEVRNLETHKHVACASWDAAEETLGIDLLNNPFLQSAPKMTMRYDDLGNVHSKVLYSQWDGQLSFVTANAYYKYNEVQLTLKAKLVVEHPLLTEEDKQVLLGVEGATIKPEDVKISYEEYTTAAGIPVVILRWDLGKIIHYNAIFAVNDVSYELNAYDVPGREEVERRALFKALDGFELN